ncbi:MAG: helicase, partial [Planctomycetota bacterium]
PYQEKNIRKQLKKIMIRRMKSELPPRWDGSPRFPQRKIEALEVHYSPEEKQAHKWLQEYGKSLQKHLQGSSLLAMEFVLKLLKKRLFSCPESFASTLEKHYETLFKSKKHSGLSLSSFKNLQRKWEEAEEDYSDDGEKEEKILEVIEATTSLVHCLEAEPREALEKLREWAEKARKKADSKAKKLIEWLETHIRPKGKWSKERVIVFTEYRTTQKWLYGILSSHGFTEKDGKTKEPRLQMLYGGMPLEEREKIKAAFQASPEISGIRILLATDAASEGIDLQNHCSRLIHYEIPWNPNRMEQRNGRIDRHGQKAPEVFIYHFVPKGCQNQTGQAGDLDGDLEFLYRVAQKVEKIREDLLGKVGPV